MAKISGKTVQTPRRSTRIDEVIPVTVIGVDSARGPYREQVFTSAVSFHGCKYESKFDVLNNSLVILELGGEAGAPSTTARGRVKWAKRPGLAGGPHITAIELEEPGNIWGVAAPPKDWLEMDEKIKSGLEPGKRQPFIVSRPELIHTPMETAEPPVPSAITSAAANAITSSSPKPAASQSVPSTTASAAVEAPHRVGAPATPVGDLMRNFQSQMETFLSEAARAAVTERAATTIADARSILREEAKRALAETVAMHATPLIEQSLREVKKASQESTLAFQVQWAVQVEEDIKKAIARIEVRHRELDAATENMSASAIDRLERALETSRREGIDRIIAGLKEQFSPLVEQAKSAAAELSACKAEAANVFEQCLEKFSAKTEEICARMEKKFEVMLCERLDDAQAEFDRTSMIATGVALDGLRQMSEKHESEARSRLEHDVTPISEEALERLKRNAEEAALKFAAELRERSQQHFEEIGAAIAALGKGKKDVAI